MCAITEELLGLERRVNDGWVQGDPDANLALLSDEITYIDPLQSKRLDGVPDVKAYFEAHRGKPFLDSYEMLDARTQTHGSVSVLTYLLLTCKGSDTTRYHCTEVYNRDQADGSWRLIHSHFSRAQP
jgi:Calcium/calmodulin dependent protein kinase II Association.